MVGTRSCEHHHLGLQLTGVFEIETDSGARKMVRPGEAYELPPGHDGWVVGDEPVVTIEFAGVRDRFRGLEFATTGDGFLAVFDGAGPRRALRGRDPERRPGGRRRGSRRRHSGEVEREAGNVRGVAVHAVTRVAGLADPGEVLVSEAAAGLLEGSGVSLEDAGEHELRGLPGRRRLYRLAG